MSSGSKGRGKRVRSRVAQAEAFAESFPKSRAAGKGRREVHRPYFSRSGHVVLAELLLSLQKPGGKVLPVWPIPRVANWPSRGAGVLLGTCQPQLKGEAGVWRESWRGTVARERGAVVNLCPMPVAEQHSKR